PIIVRPCPWQAVGWLSQLQVRPKDGRPLSGGTDFQIDSDLSAIAQEIRSRVEGRRRPAPVPLPSPVPGEAPPIVPPKSDRIDPAWRRVAAGAVLAVVVAGIIAAGLMGGHVMTWSTERGAAA